MDEAPGTLLVDPPGGNLPLVAWMEIARTAIGIRTEGGTPGDPG